MNILKSKLSKTHPYKPGIKIKFVYLLVIFIMSIMAFVFSTVFEIRVKHQTFKQMRTAAKKTLTAYKVISKEKIKRNIPINPILDPNKTGLMGEEFSEVTTTLGNLESKQTALNPEFAALLVRWISELNIAPSSDIIIHASASFPSLTIMAIIACETLEMNPVILSSLGSSSFGANRLDFTYLDIEKLLIENHIIKNQSIFVTPGGNNDNGSSFWSGGLKNIQQNAIKNNYILIIPHSLQDAIIKKWNFIFENMTPKLFINIGGNHAALGNGNCALNLPSGKILSTINCKNGGESGLIHKFNQAGIPVFHFLQIRNMALENGIHLTPTKFPEPGTTGIYFKNTKSITLLIASVIFIPLLIIFLVQRNTINNNY